MPGLTLERLNDLMTQHPDFELRGMALGFLEAFHPDTPLEKEELEEWMQADSLNPRDVLSAAHQAVACGWVENAPEGLRLTEEGKKKMRAGYISLATNSAP
jgi:hypothetical protein